MTEKRAARKYRKKPVEVWALRWAGGDYACLDEFAGHEWGRADARLTDGWPSEIADKEEVVIYNIVEKMWLPLPVGWYLIRGIQGELYPCKAEIFDATYEPAEGS